MLKQGIFKNNQKGFHGPVKARTQTRESTQIRETVWRPANVTKVTIYWAGMA
jgi:hypothetical protein